MEKERRRHPRFESLNLISYVSRDEDSIVLGHGMGRTLNICEGGILLETPEPLHPRNVVILSIGLKEEIAEITGRVVYSMTCPEGTIKSGVSFLDIDPASLHVLRQYVDESGRGGD